MRVLVVLAFLTALMWGQCFTSMVGLPPEIRVEFIDLSKRPQFAWAQGTHVRAWVRTCKPDTEEFSIVLLYIDAIGEQRTITARTQRLPSGTVPASHGMPAFTFPFSGPVVFLAPEGATNLRISVREISTESVVVIP